MKLFGPENGIEGTNHEIIRNAGWGYETVVSLPEVVSLHIPIATSMLKATRSERWIFKSADLISAGNEYKLTCPSWGLPSILPARYRRFVNGVLE